MALRGAVIGLRLIEIHRGVQLGALIVRSEHGGQNGSCARAMVSGGNVHAVEGVWSHPTGRGPRSNAELHRYLGATERQLQI